MNTDDIRLGLPSASGSDRLFNCPGSFRLEAQFPPTADTPESSSGSRIHAFLAGEKVELTLEEQDTADLCFRLSMEAHSEWSKSFLADGVEINYESKHEERMYLRNGIKPIFSGQPDVLTICGDRGLILDYKTGWGDVLTARDNRQLLSLAVLARANYNLTQVTVGIIQPKAGMKVELVTYTDVDLDSAEKHLRHRLEEAKTSDTLNAGKWCGYCRALANCPAAAKLVDEISTMEIGSGEKRREIVPNDVLFDLLEKCGPAEKMIGAIKAEAKRRLEAGETIEKGGESYVLSPGATRRTVTDASKAFSVLNQSHGLTTEEFLPCVTVKISELETALRKSTKMKALEAKDALNQALTAVGVLEQKQGAPTLERIKTPERIA